MNNFRSFPVVEQLLSLTGESRYGGAYELEEEVERSHPEWPPLPDGGIRTALVLNGTCWVFTETDPIKNVPWERVYETVLRIDGPPEDWWPVFKNGDVESISSGNSLLNKGSGVSALQFFVKSVDEKVVFFQLALRNVGHPSLEIDISHQFTDRYRAQEKARVHAQGRSVRALTEPPQIKADHPKRARLRS